MEHDATAMDVAKLMRFDPATTSRAVSILTSAGCIKPLSGYAADDRKKPLSLSEKGMRSVAEYKTLMLKAYEKASDRLNLQRPKTVTVNQLGILYFLGNRTKVFASIKPGKLV